MDDAFSVAAELVRGVQLTADQLAQLRAINHRHHTRLFARTRASSTDGTATARPLTRQEEGQLRAMLVADILEMLTPEQRKALDPAGEDLS